MRSVGGAFRRLNFGKTAARNAPLPKYSVLFTILSTDTRLLGGLFVCQTN
jgi:hypothetical protein